MKSRKNVLLDFNINFIFLISQFISNLDLDIIKVVGFVL